MAVKWDLAPSLAKLRDQVNKRWPNRSKASDGTIGDATHAASTSEHNPDDKGIVRAIDITASGINPMELVNAAIGDDRVHYVIFNKLIYSRTYNWKARKYTGRNDHTRHVHISILNNTSGRATVAQRNKAASDTSDWKLTGTATTPPKPAKPATSKTYKLGDRGAAVAEIQRVLRTVFPAYRREVKLGRGTLLATDGVFGPRTDEWVRLFQKKSGLVVDGIVGKKTIAELKKYGAKL